MTRSQDLPAVESSPSLTPAGTPASRAPGRGGGQPDDLGAPVPGSSGTKATAAEQSAVGKPRSAAGKREDDEQAQRRADQRAAWKAAISGKNARQARNRVKPKAQAPRPGMVRRAPRRGNGR
jgi:hypothetical protein